MNKVIELLIIAILLSALLGYLKYSQAERKITNTIGSGILLFFIFGAYLFPSLNRQQVGWSEWGLLTVILVIAGLVNLTYGMGAHKPVTKTDARILNADAIGYEPEDANLGCTWRAILLIVWVVSLTPSIYYLVQTASTSDWVQLGTSAALSFIIWFVVFMCFLVWSTLEPAN